MYNTPRDIPSPRHPLHSCTEHTKRHFFLAISFTQLCTTHKEKSLPHDILYTAAQNTSRDDSSSRHPSHRCVQHTKRLFSSRHPSQSFVQHTKRYFFLTISFRHLCTTHQETSLPHDILYAVAQNTPRDISSSRHPPHRCVQHTKRHLFLTTSSTQMCTTHQDTSLPHDILHTIVYNTPRHVYTFSQIIQCIKSK